MTLPAVNHHATLCTVASEFENWLSDDVIPHWATQGFTERGAVIERFFANGQADIDANKRIRVQARQIFVFAYAHQQGWLSNGADLVNKIDNYLARITHSPVYGFYPQTLNKNDDILDNHRDLYDCAFFLLANAWKFHVFNDPLSLAHADKLIQQIELALKGPSGGWFEGTYPATYRRQNPHMHLFEAFLFLFEFSQDAKWLGYAGEMFSLFENVFYDHDEHIVKEYFNCAWGTQEGTVRAEPGHMFEWVWLLSQYHKHTGKPVMNYCVSLYNKAMAIGFIANQRIPVDEVSLLGEIIKPTKRCWPMTEWIKATLVLHSLGDQTFAYEQIAAQSIGDLMHKFKNTHVPALYYDQLDINNHVLVSDCPASTLYHLLMAHMVVQTHINTTAHNGV